MTKPSDLRYPHVYIIILNWNRWRDTIECLESVFRLKHPSFTVIVCDNDSSDGSMEKIKEWAAGRLAATCDSPNLAHLIQPPIPKPVGFITLHGFTADETKISLEADLILIQTGANLGFAGGNNVGIKYALERADCDYVWLLNNDTVVDPDSLSAMLQMAEADPELGICGSLLRGYLSPHDILTAGGRRYNRWSARTRPIHVLSAPATSGQPGSLDYVEGASMLMSRSFLDTVGLLDERYFLYFEELDIAARAYPLFHLGYARESVVYHKEGASIGSAPIRANRSALSDFYQARNRLVFTGRHYFGFLLSVLCAVLLSAIQRLMIGKPRNAIAILRGALASFGNLSWQSRA